MAAFTDTGTTSTEVTGGGNIAALAGVSAEETAGAAAKIEFHDGTSSAGRRLFTLRLAANQTAGENWNTWKMVTSGHIFVNIVSGTAPRWYADVVKA